MILVTGGAGFIGSNFVLDWLAQSDEPVVNARRAHLRRQHATTCARSTAIGATSSCAATSATGRWSSGCSRRTGRARSSTSPPRATSTAASTARAISSAPTSKARSRCSKRRAPTAARSAGAEKAAFRFLHVSTDEVYGSLAADESGLPRDRCLRAEQPVLGEQGGERPPGARLAPHLRPAGADDQLQQQLRPLPVPRKADPADDRQRARRQAAAGVRRRPAGARLALRHRPLHAPSARCSRAAASARPTTSAAGTSSPTSRSSHAVCALLDELRPDPRGPHCAPRHARDRPARPRPPLRHRRAQDRARARLAPGGDVRDRPAQDRALVPRPRRLGRARADRRLPRVADGELRRAPV